MSEDKDTKKALPEDLQPFSVSSTRKPSQKTFTFTIPSLPDILKSSFHTTFNKDSHRRRATLLVILFIVATMVSGFGGAWLESRVGPNGLVTTASLSNQNRSLLATVNLLARSLKRLVRVLSVLMLTSPVLPLVQDLVQVMQALAYSASRSPKPSRNKPLAPALYFPPAVSL